MSTFLFNEIIFGPVRSRRLGSSLGINLLPCNRKVCSFNCIYCECGWTSSKNTEPDEHPSREDIATALRDRLTGMRQSGTLPDTLTYAGNGEPTLHPDFHLIISDTRSIRNELAPGSRIAVLSNASFPDDEQIIQALRSVDMNILKLDTGFDETFQRLNQAAAGITLHRIIENLKRFQGNLIIQTMLVRGIYRGIPVDNSTMEERRRLLCLYDEIKPSSVMVYTYERDTAATGLEKVPRRELEDFARQIEARGIDTLVSF